MKTFTHTIAGTVIGVALTGLLLYTASRSSNITVKEIAGKITSGFGAP